MGLSFEGLRVQFLVSFILSISHKGIPRMSPGTGLSALIRCPICDIPLVDRIDYINHLRSAHPTYATWGRKNAQISFTAIVIVTVIIVTADFLFSGNGWILLPEATVSSFFAAVAVIIAYTSVRKKRFRRDWKKQSTEGSR
jgi:hypothetical protein